VFVANLELSGLWCPLFVPPPGPEDSPGTVRCPGLFLRGEGFRTYREKQVSATTSAAGLAPKLYETRNTARMLLGEGYSARMKELGAMVAKVAAGRRTGALDAAQDVVRAADLDGFEAIQVLAAAVELIEPSH